MIPSEMNVSCSPGKHMVYFSPINNSGRMSKKISWLGYRRVCRTLISLTFCKWEYEGQNKARANERRLPYLGKSRGLIRTPVIFKQGTIMARGERISHLLRGKKAPRLEKNPDICFSPLHYVKWPRFNSAIENERSK